MAKRTRFTLGKGGQHNETRVSDVVLEARAESKSMGATISHAHHHNSIHNAYAEGNFVKRYCTLCGAKGVYLVDGVNFCSKHRQEATAAMKKKQDRVYGRAWAPKEKK